MLEKKKVGRRRLPQKGLQCFVFDYRTNKNLIAVKKREDIGPGQRAFVDGFEWHQQSKDRGTDLQ